MASFMSQLITPDPAPLGWETIDMFGNNFMQECDQVNNMDDYDANAEWMYVLSLLLLALT